MHPAHFAALNGGLESLKIVLENENYTKTHVKSKQGFTPFHLACSKGQVNILRYLISLEVDPADKTHSGVSGLHLASSKGQLEVVKFLIEDYKQDPNVTTGASRTTPL
jgi:ankyrin repeat protein